MQAAPLSSSQKTEILRRQAFKCNQCQTDLEPVGRTPPHFAPTGQPVARGASAITNIVSRVSSSFGIAVLTSMLTTRQAFHGAHLSWGLNAASPTVVNTITRAASAMGGGPRGRSIALAYIQGMVAKSSFVNAIDDVFIVTAALTLIALIPALFLKKAAAAKVRGAAMAE